jgi:hypothetical protein
MFFLLTCTSPIILWLWKVNIHYDGKNAMNYEFQPSQDNKTLVLSSLSPNHKLMSYTNGS